MKRSRVFAVLAVLTVFLSACGINSIPRAEEEAKARWADVQAAYQRRMDTLPSLVQAPRASGTHERGLQVGYANARSGADQARVSPDQLTDPNAMQRFAAAQQGVSNFILRATQEQPPENEANSNWRE